MIIYNINETIAHIESSISRADQNISQLTPDILAMEGFSGNKTRHLYNNICNMPTKINYLEVGTYLGSTLISATYKNNVNAIAVDNWSEFGGPKQRCIDNIQTYATNSKDIKLIEKNFTELNNNDINMPIDIYLYDGDHSYESHKLAITYISQFLSSLAIILVDDFRADTNWVRVINGTKDGFKESSLKIVYEKHLTSLQEIDGKTNYWNGCGIFLCQK